MRSALAFKDEIEEVPVSSNEVLEVHVATIRKDVDELKEDFRAAVIRIDATIKTLETTVRAEISAMAAKATKEIDALAARMDAQFARVDAQFERVDAQFAEIRQDLREVRKDGEKMREEIHKIGSKLNALFWLIGVLCAAATLFLTVGEKFHWFKDAAGVATTPAASFPASR